jgi:hydrogenase/urease accessory protein HupE
MDRLKWWFRVVGAIYVLLGVGFIPFLNAARIPLILPNLDAPVGGVAYRALLDFSFMFGLDLVVIGMFLVWASREPSKHLNLVWLVIWLEIIRGIADDIYMIARGYDAPFYFGFIVFHLVIIITGYLFVRQAQAETA